MATSLWTFLPDLDRIIVRMIVLAVPIVFASLLFVPYTERNERGAKDPYVLS